MLKRLLLENCPNECNGTHKITGMVLPEGPIRECRECGQLFSSCSAGDFTKAVDAWSTVSEDLLSERELRRIKARRRHDFQAFTKLLGKKSNIRLLDVGCSDGVGVSVYDCFGISAEGIDPAKQPIELGRSRGLKLHHGLLHEAKFHDESFDVLTMYEVIEHVPNPVRLLGECNRILKYGGVLVVGTGNTDSWTRLIKKEEWDFFSLHGHGGHISFFSLSSLTVLGGRTGFRMGAARTYSVKFYERGEINSVGYRLFKILGELLTGFARLLGKGHQMEVCLVKEKSFS